MHFEQCSLWMNEMPFWCEIFFQNMENAQLCFDKVILLLSHLFKTFVLKQNRENYIIKAFFFHHQVSPIINTHPFLFHLYNLVSCWERSLPFSFSVVEIKGPFYVQLAYIPHLDIKDVVKYKNRDRAASLTSF